MLALWLVTALAFARPSRKAPPPPPPPDPRVELAATYPLGPLFSELVADRVFAESRVGAQVVDIATGDEVWAFDADAPLVPASTMKVVTAAAALRSLGPAWRFRTTFLRDGEVTPEGILEGNLILRGNGDPTLVVEKLWKLVHDLQIEGVLEVSGDLILDASYFGDGSLIPGWDKPLDIANAPSYFPPLSALSVNFNTAAIVVAPGPKAGEPARVELETPVDSIVVESTVTTIDERRKGWLKLEREADPKTGVLTFRLEGEVPAGGEVQRHYRGVADPLRHTADIVRALLKEEGIRVRGRVRFGPTPRTAEPVVELVSPPLAEILNHTNKFSSNFMAEQVLRAVGAEAKGAPGTTAKGIAVVSEYLGSLGIPAEEYVLVNGSGLSRDIRLRPTHLTAVMMDMARDPTIAPEFLATLSVAGVDGTLRRRFSGPDRLGRIRGKTGSLDGVQSVVAIAHAADGRSYTYALIVNDFSRNRPVRSVHDRFGSLLIGGGVVSSPDEDADSGGP